MICACYRWLISSSLDSGTPPGRLLRRHLGRCAACREFHERSLDLAAALRDEPVPLTARPPVRVRARSARRRLAAASLAAASILIAVLFLLLDRQPVSPVVTVAPDPSGSVQVAAVTIPSSDELMSALRGSVAEIADPLGRPVVLELKDLHAQYRHARETLLAYLPSDSAQPPTPREDNL